MAISINKTRLSLVIDKSIQTQLKQSANGSGVTVNGLLNIIINDYLNKSKTTDTLQLLLQLNSSNTDKTLLVTTLDKVITTPTQKNYDTFIELLNNLRTNKEITLEVYDGFYNMAKCIPIQQ